ncbi:MAG: BrnT family toxin [Candidatus Levybacteria bacterium]|nr:BrnT family toxin [Candidatus Levybacteria bacterium]
MKGFKDFTEFEWDKHNTGHVKKHNVSNTECEELFFDENKVVFKDLLHSQGEDRFILLGKTKMGRLLYLVFTIRGERIRVISCRDLNKKEAHLYEKKA